MPIPTSGSLQVWGALAPDLCLSDLLSLLRCRVQWHGHPCSPESLSPNLISPTTECATAQTFLVCTFCLHHRPSDGGHQRATEPWNRSLTHAGWTNDCTRPVRTSSQGVQRKQAQRRPSQEGGHPSLHPLSHQALKARYVQTPEKHGLRVIPRGQELCIRPSAGRG